MTEETRRKAIIKFAHGAGPRLVAHELGITLNEAASVQASMVGQRPRSTRRRSTPRKR